MKSTRAQWWTLLALVVSFILVTAAMYAKPAHSMSISQPGATSIAGVAPCAGPLISGEPLVYNGTNICTGPANNVHFNGTNSSGGAQQMLNIDTSNNLALGDGTNLVYIQNTSKLQLNGQGLIWNGGNDLTEVNAPRMPLTLVAITTSATGAITWAPRFTPDVAMHVRQWDLNFSAAPTGCTTWPVYEIVVGTAQASTAITLTSNTGLYTKTFTPIAVAASSIIYWGQTTAGVGCTFASNTASAVLELSTD